jgi:hypothetical protein
LEAAPACLLFSLLFLLSALFASVLFFEKSAFYGHFLDAAFIFAVVNRENRQGSSETERLSAALES